MSAYRLHILRFRSSSRSMRFIFLAQKQVAPIDATKRAADKYHGMIQSGYPMQASSHIGRMNPKITTPSLRNGTAVLFVIDVFLNVITPLLIFLRPSAASFQGFLAGSVLSRGASSRGTSIRNRPQGIFPLARAFGCNTQLQRPHWQLDEWKQAPRHCRANSQTILCTIPFPSFPHRFIYFPIGNIKSKIIASCCNFAYLEICYRNLIIYYQLVKVKCFDLFIKFFYAL